MNSDEREVLTSNGEKFCLFETLHCCQGFSFNKSISLFSCGFKYLNQVTEIYQPSVQHSGMIIGVLVEKKITNISFRKIFCRIAGKVVIMTVKADVLSSVGCLQVWLVMGLEQRQLYVR